MSFILRVFEGDWESEHEIDSSYIEESLRKGQLFGLTNYLGFLGEKRIHCGDFDGALQCIEQIDEIRDLFQYDLAKTKLVRPPLFLCCFAGGGAHDVADRGERPDPGA